MNTTKGIARATAAVIAAAVVLTAGFEGSGPRVPNAPVPTVRAYKDSVNVTTICFGETQAERPDLKMGDTDTVQDCKARFPAALKKYDDGLTACLHHDIPDGMHVVLISTTYNIGIAAFCRSSMAADINRGDLPKACHDLLMYDHAGGRELSGLLDRRRVEEHDCLMALRHEAPPEEVPQAPPTPKPAEATKTWTTQLTPSPSSASSPSSSYSTTSAKPAGPSSPPNSKREPLLSRLLHWLASRLP